MVQNCFRHLYASMGLVSALKARAIMYVLSSTQPCFKADKRDADLKACCNSGLWRLPLILVLGMLQIWIWEVIDRLLLAWMLEVAARLDLEACCKYGFRIPLLT